MGSFGVAIQNSKFKIQNSKFKRLSSSCGESNREKRLKCFPDDEFSNLRLPSAKSNNCNVSSVLLSVTSLNSLLSHSKIKINYVRLD
jgi:hypothetical protein